MKYHMHEGTLVMSVLIEEIPRSTDAILESIERNGVFEERKVFRRVRNGCTETILSHGTDRTEEKSFDYWIENRKKQLQIPYVAERVGKVDLRDADEACLECKERYSFEDVVSSNLIGDSVRLTVLCPYQNRTKLINIYGEHFQCPTYMQVSGGPRVFWGTRSNSRESDIEQLRKALRSRSLDDGVGFSHSLIYNAKCVRSFDDERFIFLNNVKPAQVLKCVIEYNH